jgi:hypothetical protein
MEKIVLNNDYAPIELIHPNKGKILALKTIR